MTSYLESFPFYSELPFSPYMNYPVFIFSAVALSYAKRRRTLDRWKASTIILESDRRSPDHPNSSRVQLRHYPEQYPHEKLVIRRLLLRMSVQVPRVIHVPACQSVPSNYALRDRRPYQLALDSSALPRRSAGPVRSAVSVSPLPGEAYSHCLARTDVWGSTPISRITRTSL
jgi:hypothetical protein